MRLVKPSFEILHGVDVSLLKDIEMIGRTCYKSESKIDSHSSKGFVENIIAMGHESVIEHRSITVRFICDRGVSHEIVRHRLCSFSQESTRYCNYGKGDHISFIVPQWMDVPEAEHFTIGSFEDDMNHNDHDKGYAEWIDVMLNSERCYIYLISKGWKPEQARSVLPNSLKTEIVVTANLREWRTIFKQRTSKKAHPQMRELMQPLLTELKRLVPVIFDDIIYEGEKLVQP